MSTKVRNWRKDKGIIDAFHDALGYLVDIYGPRKLSRELTRIGECLAPPVAVDHSQVCRWLNKGVIPHSKAMIYIVIKVAEIKKRTRQFFDEANAKIDETEYTLQIALDYLYDSYPDIMERLPAAALDLDERTIPSWHKGIHKPRQRKGADYMKEIAPNIPDDILRCVTTRVPNKIETEIMALVAGETGLGRKLDYALVPIVERYFDLFEPFLTADDKRVWDECFADYKKRKAQGLFEA